MTYDTLLLEGFVKANTKKHMSDAALAEAYSHFLTLISTEDARNINVRFRVGELFGDQPIITRLPEIVQIRDYLREVGRVKVDVLFPEHIGFHFGRDVKLQYSSQGLENKVKDVLTPIGGKVKLVGGPFSSNYTSNVLKDFWVGARD